MKIIKSISLVIFILMLLEIICSADSCNWYIKKNGNSAPGFPADAEFISNHNGYFIDRESNNEGKKVLYLTFDAGYENGNIEKILDIMKSEDVRGAFFILSNLINKNPDLVCRIAEEGHLICNHTTNHKDVSKMSKSDMINNITTLEEEYESCTGLKMEKIFRFPEGKYSKEAILALEDAGYKTVFWSMAYDDWDNTRQMDCAKAKDKLLSTTHNGAIILLHPTSATNAQILGDLIREWKNQGYTFGSLNEI